MRGGPSATRGGGSPLPLIREHPGLWIPRIATPCYGVLRLFGHFGAFHFSPGSVLGRFGLQIRILREKLCRMMGSDLFFINF